MLKLFCWATFIVLLLGATAVFAKKPELEGNSVVARGSCFVEDTPYAQCFVVKVDDVLYLAVHDRHGEFEIHQLTTADIPRDGLFQKEHVKLLWSRNSI